MLLLFPANEELHSESTRRERGKETTFGDSWTKFVDEAKSSVFVEFWTIASLGRTFSTLGWIGAFKFTFSMSSELFLL